jgi:hypothetical protein
VLQREILPSSSATSSDLQTPGQVIQAIIDLRETVIRAEMPNWEPHRSMLREAMIENFIAWNL